MKKLLPAVTAAALVLAACGGGSDAVAATVNGEDITVGEIEALIGMDGESTIPKETFSEFLGYNIQWRIVDRAAEDQFGIVIGDEETAAEADVIFEESGQDMTREEFLAANRVTEEFLSQVARQQLLDTQIREVFAAEVEEPTQEEIDGVIAEAQSLYCASHILVATEAEADDALARIEAGEDFADVAAEVSTDASAAQGGDLGCSPTDRFVPEFGEALTAAEVDMPTDPVETEFGFHLILRRENEVPTEEQVIEALSAQAVGEAANAWFIEQVEAAEVTVDESYGTWQTDPPQVNPPTE